MEITPITGIRSASLFAPRRVEAEAPPFVVDEPARADDEERSAGHEGEESGLDDDLELDPEEAENAADAEGSRIDVTA